MKKKGKKESDVARQAETGQWQTGKLSVLSWCKMEIIFTYLKAHPGVLWTSTWHVCSPQGPPYQLCAILGSISTLSPFNTDSEAFHNNHFS